MNAEEKKSPLLIAVTGGIGSGKSVVCRILAAMGYPVYDCDSRAKAIMDCSAEIMDRIAEEICQEAIISTEEGRKIDRRRLADIVFNDSLKLQQLNSIVHEAVKEDIHEWKASLSKQGNPPRKIFVETAILYESGLDKIVDRIWIVTAPLQTRITRAMKRDGSDRKQIESRISKQSPMFLESNMNAVINQDDPSSENIAYIVNDDVTPILPRILDLLA